MRYLKAEITRNELASFSETFPAYELPILQHLHGEEAVQIRGEIENTVEWPLDAGMEYSRLENRYGKVEGTDQSIASLVYGVGVQGQQRLALAIAQAKQEADANPIDTEAQEAAQAAASAPKVAVPYADSPTEANAALAS